MTTMSPHSVTRTAYLDPVTALVMAGVLLCAVVDDAAAEAAASAAKADAGGYDLFLLIGQSNADGRGGIAAVPAELAQPSPHHIIFYHNGFGTTPDWMPLAPGFSVRKPQPTTLPTGNFGIEVTFAPAIAEAFPGMKVAFIKAARGNTGMGFHWHPGTDPNGTEKGEKPGPCYRTALDAVNMAVARLPAGQHRWRGILWHQGENDAGDKNYDKRLGTLITRLRADLKTPELPFVFGGLRPGIGAGWNTIAPRAVEAIPRTAFVSSDGLDGDPLHFSSAALLEFGKRYAATITPLLQDAKPVLVDGGTPQATLRRTEVAAAPADPAVPAKPEALEAQPPAP